MSPAPRPSTAARVQFDVDESVLHNGLRLLVLEDHAAPVVSYQVHYAAGSRNERPGITGISHLFEHMMFKGTPSVGPEEFARQIQAHGGELNAFTTEDNTSYYENLPSDCIDLAIRLESDRQANLLLTEENLASEREVVRNERLFRTVNTPYGLARELLMSTAFQRHPYSWPVVGWDPDLVAISLEDCRQYFGTYYAANNTTVVVAGDVEASRVRELVESAYGDMERRPSPPVVVTHEDEQRGERRAEFAKKVEAAAILAGFHIPELTHEDTFALLALSTSLSGGDSSRLYRRFLKTGRAASAHTDVGFSFLNRDPSLFTARIVTHPGDDPAELERELWDEVEKVRADGIEDDELARAIKQQVASFVMQAQNNFYRGLQVGLFQVRADDWSRVNGLVSGYTAVTPDDVRRVAERYLSPANRTVVTVRPETS